MNITELYDDNKFNDILVWIANKKRIIDFDDFRQDVFLDIIDCKHTTMAGFKRSANKIASRYYDAIIESDIEDFASYDEHGNHETSDETMSRLIYEGKAHQVG